ncbi:hypothetical protein [Methylocucumis oryzae]|uniref:Uncharacterized protein n=1 Tax=Methylocucumis oryzae TaxID=1632867 RepID=A0A0F3IR69_9GAMM|nr:hypothetical protein [Methylocucumis oryzae]KJV08084.1 hypothetical protein VZ94_00560 [Methylocucumis oryzae]
MQLTADISAQEAKLTGFNNDGSDDAKAKLISLKNKLAASKRKLETLDAKYKEIEENTTATIKQKSVFLRAKAASGELPFDASVIDNTDAVLISREGQIIKAGAIFEFKTLKYVDNKINDLALVTELNIQEKFFIVRARNLTYDIRIYLADLHNYQLQPVAMTKEDWEVAVMLAKNLSIKDIIELGVDTFTKYRKQIKLYYGYHYISSIDGDYSVVKNYNSNNPIDDNFVFPDANSEDIKRAIAKQYYVGKNTNEVIRDLIIPLYGSSGWEESLKQYANLTPQEEVLSQAALAFSKIAVEYDKSEIDLASTISYSDRIGLIERIESTINGDNRESIKQWVNEFLNDRKSKALEIIAEKRRKDEEEQVKSDPNYKEIPVAIADKLKSIGITAKYNAQSVYAGRSHRSAFTMLFLQDSNGKNGLLFKAKEDLKTYFGAQFGTDIGAGLMGAWWFITADKDINKVLSTITGENSVAELAEQKAKPEKLIVPEGKVKIGDTVAGFVVTSLGKSWEAKDYHISKVKADSGFEIEEGDSIQYARF